MAIEISPYAFRRAEAGPAFRSPIGSLLVVSGVLLVLSAMVAAGVKILGDKVVLDNAALSEEITALRAKRNPKEVESIQATLGVMGSTKHILDQHGTGENIFTFLEEILQENIIFSNIIFSNGDKTSHMSINVVARSLSAAAVQVAAFEEDPKARIRSAKASSFPIDEKDGTVKFGESIDFGPNFLLQKKK